MPTMRGNRGCGEETAVQEGMVGQTRDKDRGGKGAREVVGQVRGNDRDWEREEER